MIERRLRIVGNLADADARSLDHPIAQRELVLDVGNDELDVGDEDASSEVAEVGDTWDASPVSRPRLPGEGARGR